MDRRTLLKLVSVVPATSLEAETPTHCSSSGIGTDFAGYEFAFFTPEEQALLDRLTEMIIPADDHSPGAREARVPAFADLMVSASPAAVKQDWRNGLVAFRAAASGARLEDVLALAAAEEQNPPSELGRFFVELKRMTIDGYYTSSIGIHRELEYQGNEYRKSAPFCDHPQHGAA
jgi:hypothetical protein